MERLSDDEEMMLWSALLVWRVCVDARHHLDLRAYRAMMRRHAMLVPGLLPRGLTFSGEEHGWD